MKLSAEEEKALKRLMSKREAPESATAKTLNVSIDLGDEAQVTRAQRLGLLDAFEDDAGEEPEEEETPQRGGYFGSKGEAA